MITTENKKLIVEKLKAQIENYASQAKMAVAFSISSAQMSRILGGEVERVISDAAFITIARKLNLQLGNKAVWNTAQTPVFKFIFSQLEACKAQGLSALLCDRADIGKTYTAKIFANENKNTVYIDCSQVKTKSRLIRKIAESFGSDSKGKLTDVYDDLVFHLNGLEKPLVILDEAGDLDPGAFLEIKALWNATEYSCGWYMMGADGLRAKVNKNMNNKKIGYAELFRRFGTRFQKISPDGVADLERFTKSQTAAIAKANGVTDIQTLFTRTQGSLQRIYFEIIKSKANEQAAN